MSWVRLDDRFRSHPKFLRAVSLAKRNGGWVAHLWVCALAWSSDYCTDGFIPTDVLGSVAPLVSERLANECAEHLVVAGLWERVDGGFRIHDYLDWQPSAEQVLARRNATAKRVANWRTRETVRKSNGVTDALHVDVCNTVTNAPVTAAPSPSPSPSQIKIPPQTTSGTPPGGADDPAPRKLAKDRKGARITADWTPSAEVLAAFAAQGIDALRAVPEFVDFWLSAAGAYASKRDWDAAFRNQIRRMVEQGRAPRMGGSSAAPADRAPNGRPWIQRPPTAAPPSGPREIPPENFDFSSPDDGPASTTTPEAQAPLFGAPRRTA